ncbi:MAG: hypothetical protein WCA61_05975 [Nitrososphaeraceae archaeon]
MVTPFTDAEKLNGFTQSWITPIQGIWIFLAGVGAVIKAVYYFAYYLKGL